MFLDKVRPQELVYLVTRQTQLLVRVYSVVSSHNSSRLQVVCLEISNKYSPKLLLVLQVVYLVSNQLHSNLQLEDFSA